MIVAPYWLEGVPVSADPLTADELAEIRRTLPSYSIGLWGRAAMEDLLAEVERLQAQLAQVRRLTVYERFTDGLEYVRADELRRTLAPSGVGGR